jgi:hypothetical protein
LHSYNNINNSTCNTFQLYLVVNTVKKEKERKKERERERERDKKPIERMRPGRHVKVPKSVILNDISDSDSEDEEQ